MATEELSQANEAKASHARTQWRYRSRTTRKRMGGGATATRKVNIVTVTTTRGADTPNDATRRRHHREGKRLTAWAAGWYKVNIVKMDAEGKPGRPTVFTDIENTMEKFSEVHTNGRGGVTTVSRTPASADLGHPRRSRGRDYRCSIVMRCHPHFLVRTEGTVTYAYGDDMDTDTTDRSG